MIGGGAPSGSVVLLASEPGAGGREFCYTAAAMNATGLADPDQFDFYYGDLEGAASLPEAVHYVSFTSRRQAVVGDMSFVLDSDLVEAFRGVLSRLEGENIVQFETEIGDTGFDISNVRKIR